MTFIDPALKAFNDFDIDDMPAIGGDPAEPMRTDAAPGTHTPD